MKKYIVRVMNADFDKVNAYNSRFPFLYLLNFINEYADKNKVNDFIKKADIAKEISDKLFNINLTKLIMDDNTLFYNIYIDETGDPNKKDEKIFAVGGYYVKNIEHKVWYEKCSLKLEDLEKKYFTEDNKYYYDEKFRKIYHRNKIDKDKKGIITTDAFNFLKENDAKFICIYEEKTFQSRVYR